MRTDLEYFASILNVFLDSDRAHVDLEDFQKANIEVVSGEQKYNEKFVFHMQLAVDNNLIGLRDGPVAGVKNIGLKESLDELAYPALIPIRLTQNGHDFASALNNKEVLTKLKSEFKDAPFKVVFDGGQKLLQHLMKKKLDNLLE